MFFIVAQSCRKCKGALLLLRMIFVNLCRSPQKAARLLRTGRQKADF